ncbi:MAG: hypothetical protein ABFE13_21650, partial [Phycisphaerales bacterium]
MVVRILLVLAMSIPARGATRFHVDRPFVQDYSEQVPLAPEVAQAKLLKVRMDRNRRILVLSDKGLLQVHAGVLRPERQDRPLADMQIKDIEVHEGQFMYLTDKYVLSNASGGRLLIGASEGRLRIDPNSLESQVTDPTRAPCTDLRCRRTIGNAVWFGTSRGAFSQQPDGRIDYYASKRWLLDDAVIDIWPGPSGSVLILSQRGLNIIHFREMTLAQKAEHFDQLTRRRHIRFGFNSAFEMSTPGDLSTGTLVDQDNDGLWTAMYLAGELFRYAVTKSDEALRNCYESFDAMERLCQITGIEGFPARSFERAGYQVADKQHWHNTPDGQWSWKGTTSSDEIVGHFFAYAIFAEVAPDDAWKKRAVALIDAIMDHIVRNNWYLIDYDGKPTLWGRWNPEYVNQFPRQVGDRRLNSVEIIAFLQTA